MNSGLVAALLASLSFSLMNVCARELSTAMPVTETVFLRGLIGVAITLAVMRARRVRLASPRPWLLSSRGLMGGGSLLATFYTVAYMKLADASILANLAPLFVVLGAALLLGEKLPARCWPAFGAAFAGTLLIVEPGAGTLQSTWAAVGIVGAVLAAGASLSIRSLSQDHPTETIMLAFLGAAVLMPLPFAGEFIAPRTADVPWIAGMGAASFAGQWCLTRAYTLAPTAEVAAARYTGILFDLGFGFVLWGELLSAPHVAGGMGIVVGCLILLWPELARKPVPARVW
ncbi:MAG: DMT family transporter [Armatimonadetes bacterium]|nr:DMT family transporter [Armatimonadota bacterium]